MSVVQGACPGFFKARAIPSPIRGTKVNSAAMRHSSSTEATLVSSNGARSASVVSGHESNSSEEALTVVSFYKFADLPDYEEKQKPLVELCNKLRVSGVILLASEGINGSIAGRKDSVLRVLEDIQSDERLAGLRVTPEDESLAPFRWGHIRVRLKKEVVPLGVPGLDPSRIAGKYVKPAEWNELIRDPATMVIDVRNWYETRIGSFEGAVDPKTDTFREFPDWVENNLTNTSKRVATFCTGGIRCEKATAFLLERGFKEVYHLEGGILRYLEEIEPVDSLWRGECFVFDKRVAVEHGLKRGSYELCFACKRPVSQEDMKSAEWEAGVSCPFCFKEKSFEEKERARARQKQFDISGVIGGM